MTPAEALYGMLSNDPALAALVGTRITQERPPADSIYPHVTFTMSSADPLHTFNHGPGMVPEDWDIEIYAPEIETRALIRTAVFNLFGQGVYSHPGSGVRCIILQPGEGPMEVNDAPLVGWQQTWRVIAGDP